MNSRARGSLSEQYAVKYLLAKGYQILETNYYIYGGEVDIIASHEQQIVFVEVKSIFRSYKDELMSLLSKKKLFYLERAINHWLLKHDKLNQDWRLDYIGIILGPKNSYIDLKHLENLEL